MGAEGFKLLLVPETQVRVLQDGKAGIVEFGTGWERLIGPFELVADIPPGGSIRMSRLLYDTIEVVDGTA
jgi:hypothetical protein